ncbi:MAG: hypothetical protein OXB88_06070 [Bacteriovoracales bacterium]|nr:hypothetical protein [Bacteriovoracales bacterium]
MKRKEEKMATIIDFQKRRRAKALQDAIENDFKELKFFHSSELIREARALTDQIRARCDVDNALVKSRSVLAELMSRIAVPKPRSKHTKEAKF